MAEKATSTILSGGNPQGPLAVAGDGPPNGWAAGSWCGMLVDGRTDC